MDFFKTIPTHMDYDGQAKAEKLSRIIITLFGVVGLVWGYIIQQYSQTVYIVGAGFVLASLVSLIGSGVSSKQDSTITIPPWPMYRKKPLNWQKPRDNADSGDHVNTKKGKKNK